MLETLTARETFVALLDHGPLIESDAVVVLCGEDVKPRLEVAAGLLGSRGSPAIVLTGGKHAPPRWIGAEKAFAQIMGIGVAHDRIRVDVDAMNTHEQASNVIDMALSEGWKRILLVASAYHSYRAFLTFVKELERRDATKLLQLVNAPASHRRWNEAPDGMTETRAELLATEFRKIAEYEDVASYDAGIEYLRYWEGL